MKAPFHSNRKPESRRSGSRRFAPLRFPGPAPLCAALLAAVALSLPAGPLTPGRIAALPASAQAEWREYFERSSSNALADAAALRAEVAALGLPVALRAPAGGNFRLPAKTGDAWHAGAEAARLADTVLSYQTPSGGWSKHTDYSQGPRRPGMQWTSLNQPGRSPHYVATFDNRATIEEMRLLAAVARATGREDFRAGFARGLDFIFAAQYPNGGWPQVYPLQGGYHDNITFNDGAMVRILGLLQEAARGGPCFSFVCAGRREQAARALAAGIECVLRTQVAQDGRKTVWGAQHDPLTLEPAAARLMEPAALSGLESAGVLEFLMSITNPPPEVVAAVEGGLAWFDRVKITGLARIRRDGRTVFEPDPSSSQVFWARFYDLSDNRPVFPGRDGVIYDSFAEMAAQNRTGYDYLSTLPGSIVNNGQRKWRRMLDGAAGL